MKKKKVNKNLIVKPVKKTEVVTVKDDIDGEVMVNGKSLIKDKDYFLSDEGVKLSDATKTLLNDKNTKSYGVVYSRTVIRKLK